MADQQDNVETVEDATAEGGPRQAKVLWDDSKMSTNFANVVNMQSTREQVDLFFGTNQTWNVANEAEVKVELSNRIILTPHAAKRLWLALGNILKEHETRHGALEVSQ